MEPIKWGDHCIGLVRSLAEFYKNIEFIDCELDTDGGLLSGHRVILAACSPYLKKLLLEHEGRRIVPLKEVKYKDMKYILDFIYFGEVGVPLAGVASFAETTNFLKISTLRSCLSPNILRSCLSPNTFKKIFSEVPVEQLVGSCESKNNIDLLTNYEQSSPTQGSRKMCHKTLHSVNEDRNHLQTDSESENNLTNELEHESCRANDLEALPNFPRIRVVDEESLDKFIGNSHEVLHSTSPVSVKIEEDDNLNDVSDSDVPHVNAEEYSFIHDEATEKTVEWDCESESRMKSRNEKGICVGEHSYHGTENMSETKALETKSCDQVPLARDVNSASEEAQNVVLTYIDIKEESEDFKETSGLQYDSALPSEEAESSCAPRRDGAASCPSTSKTPYQCDVCESSFKSNMGLSRHLGSHAGTKPFACDFCGKTFQQRSYLVYHTRTHTGEKPYACDVCRAAYRSKSKLNAHMRTHTGEKPFACSACGQAFSLKHHLARHVRGHTGEKPYRCKFCAKAFHDDGSLSAHQRAHLGQRRRARVVPEGKPFACAVCQKAFARKVYLQTHMLTHDGRRPYLCSACGKAFAQKSALNLHALIHAGVKAHLCSVCGKAFLIPHQLRRHMRTHTGDKPHRCGVCERFFADKGNLKAHMAIHTGAKHYRCCACDEAFNLRSELKKHSAVHKEGKPPSA